LTTTQATEVAVQGEQIKALRRDLEKLEASARWLWRTVMASLIGAIVALFFNNFVPGA
jgi:hypothetical protein